MIRPCWKFVSGGSSLVRRGTGPNSPGVSDRDRVSVTIGNSAYHNSRDASATRCLPVPVSMQHEFKCSSRGQIVVYLAGTGRHLITDASREMWHGDAENRSKLHLWLWPPRAMADQNLTKFGQVSLRTSEWPVTQLSLIQQPQKPIVQHKRCTLLNDFYCSWNRGRYCFHHRR